MSRDTLDPSRLVGDGEQHLLASWNSLLSEVC